MLADSQEILLVVIGIECGLWCSSFSAAKDMEYIKGKT